MALVSCPECRKEISDLAPSCPNCGVRLRKTMFGLTRGKPESAISKGVRIGFGMFVILPLCILVAVIVLIAVIVNLP